MKVKGSCLCGEIEFEVALIENKIFNCHCSRCQKSHGAAHATQAFADGSSLIFLKGAERLSEYKGGQGIRAFCRECGSRLMNYAEDKSNYTSIALACINTAHTLTVRADCFSDDKANWHKPNSNIPCYQAYPPIDKLT